MHLLFMGFVLAAGGFALTFYSTKPLISKGAGCNSLEERRRTVSRLGGMPLVISFLAVCGVAVYLSQEWSSHLVLVISTVAMFGLGFWDDISPLGAKKKLLGQVLIAYAAFYFGLQIETFKNPLTGIVYSLGPWSAVATVFWLVALTNLINLIDGIDGLAAGIALMLMCLLAYVGFHGQPFSLCIAVGMAGALLAFLYFNFPPAKICLGNGGTYFLGYLVGGLAIQNASKSTIAAALIAPIFALALPILDVVLSILRRGLHGFPIFRPDRRHIRHRPFNGGWSRRRTVLTLYAISLFFLVVAFVAFWSDGRLTAILVGCSFVVLLIVAPSLGLIKNWLTVGTAVGNSFEMRKEIQYALLLRSWLELESERSETVDDLWINFTFAASRLGFAEAWFAPKTGPRRQWQSVAFAGSEAGGGQMRRHDFLIGKEMGSLGLRAGNKMSPDTADVLSEVFAEAWLNALKRWKSLHPSRINAHDEIQVVKADLLISPHFTTRVPERF